MKQSKLREKVSTFQIIISGFIMIILIGTILLMFPFSARSGEVTSLDCALFTSTSAVCVTGLVMKDTASYWSPFGQAVILVLIQTGGLGVVTIAASIETASGKKLSLREKSLVEDSISGFQVGGVQEMARMIIRIVFMVEAIGAAALMPVFCIQFGLSGIWMAVFHSVSAFCNAGFDLMGTHSGEFSSLTAFSRNPFVIVPVCLLIVLGGIGFHTWVDFIRNRRRVRKYRLQSKVILVTTAVLIAVPAIVYFLFEFSDAPILDRISLSLFQAITPRTAGFNTADLTKMTHSGIALMIILMVIGGSPGSTAGGMKTTTLAVLLANASSVFRRKKETHLFGKRIEESVIRSACALFVTYFVLAVSFAMVISLVEGLPMKECLFETASAVGTVGLTLGITPSLGPLSHILLVVLMFIGRAGGLTLMYAAISSRAEVSRRPVEKIIVG